MEKEEQSLRDISPNLNSTTGGLTFSAAVIIYFAVMLFGALLTIFLTAVCKVDEHNDLFLYLNYLCAPVAITACISAVLKVRKIHPKYVFPVKCGSKYYVIAVLLIFGLLFSLSWLDSAVVEFFKLFGYKPRGAESYFPNLDGWRIIPAFLVIAVLPAVLEEALFRGVLLNCCERNMGTVRTVLVVGFCFSLFHASPEQTVYQFIAGCVFALLAVRSGSILPSVIMHFTNNGIILVFAACNLFNESGNLNISNTVNIILIVVGALSLIGGLIWLFLDKKPLIKFEKGGVKKFFMFASVGIAVLGLTWILSLFGVS